MKEGAQFFLAHLKNINAPVALKYKAIFELKSLGTLEAIECLISSLNQN